MTDDHLEYPPPIPPHRRQSIDRSLNDDGATAAEASVDHRHGQAGAKPPPRYRANRPYPSSRSRTPSGPVPAVQRRSAGAGPAPSSGTSVTSSNSATMWMAAAALALLAAAAIFGRITNRDDDGQGPASADGSQVAAGDTVSSADDQTADQSLVPAQLPAADEAGLVGLELPLLDAYTGTGTTGSVELYVNILTGRVCHRFDASALPDRFRAYVREAAFPQEGPIVVDLGDVADATPLCVSSTPIDLSRALDNGDQFYVAAQSPDRDILLRGQLSQATIAFDNRDPTLKVGAQVQTDDETDNDLFGRADEGAYLVVEAGRVAFEGAVPDEATAQQLRAAFVPLSGLGVDVVDNLRIEPGAPPPSGRVVVANALLFESGQSQVDSDASVLQTLADIMTVNPSWTMTITGHTDNVGGFDANDQLSLRRADNVRSRLTELGIGLERMRVQGAGAEFPIADNSTEAGRAQNRRIEITIDSSG